MVTPDADHAHPDLAAVMNRLAHELQEEHGDVEATLAAITRAAVRDVPGADECGIGYVVDRRRIEPRASTGPLPKEVDALQQTLGQGPCLDAAWEHDVVRVDDLATDLRWPELAACAGEIGVGSMLCFQLFVAGDHMGALNLYSARPGAFDEESVDIGLMLAGHASVALVGALREANLRRAMDNRDVIGQAKGILMERHRLTGDQAFAVLTRASQELNRKLVDIARQLTDTGAMPPERTRRRSS